MKPKQWHVRNENNYSKVKTAPYPIVDNSSHHTVSGHNRPTSKTPFEWRFAGEPIAARFDMRLRYTHQMLFNTCLAFKDCSSQDSKFGTLVKSAYQKKKVSYFSTKTYVVGTQKNRLNETVLLSTQNIC